MPRNESEFARCFAEAWAAPVPERLVELLHPDVVLYQPHLPPIRGRAAALGEFRRLFRWLPGTHGRVDRACGSDGVLFIEWLMMFPIGKKGVCIPAVDRFFLQGGLGIERTVFFDQTPLLAAVLARPQLWPGFVRYRLGR